MTLRSFSLEQCKHSGTGIRLFNIKQKDNETITICFVLCDLFPFYKPKVLQYHLVVQLGICVHYSSALPSTAANISTRYVHNASPNEDTIFGVACSFKSISIVFFFAVRLMIAHSTDFKSFFSLADPQISLNSHLKAVGMSKRGLGANLSHLVKPLLVVMRGSKLHKLFPIFVVISGRK